MISIKHLIENTSEIREALGKRMANFDEAITQAIEAENQRKKITLELETLRNEINAASKNIGALMREGKKGAAEEIKNTVSTHKKTIKLLESQLKEAEKTVQENLAHIPNTPHELVKKGKNEADNEIIDEFLTENKRQSRVSHWDIAQKLDIIDFELGVKITGAGFPVFKNGGARLVRGLINFFLDRAREQGYTEYNPPLLINANSGFSTGQLPDKEGQMYHIEGDGLYLIPTAEVPLTNIFRDMIIPEKKLPLKCTAYSPCFRREAGSYGKDVRGLNRLHQFDKVEIVQISKPEHSYEILDDMVKYIKSLLIDLGIPTRILRLCGGDLGFTSALTYDFEVFSGGQGRWLEVSSVSNFETYQANRLKLRYKSKEGPNKMLHTLNGSALALPRIIAAILENNFHGETVILPEVLHSYVGMEQIR